MPKDPSILAEGGYEPVAVENIPKEKSGAVKCNLYVYLSGQKRFVLFLPKGEKFTLARKAALERHQVQALFVRTESDSTPSVSSFPQTSKFAKFEVLGLENKKTLVSVFESLSANMDSPPQEAIQALEKMADEIIEVLAPEAEQLKNRILENLQHIWLMNDAAAIISLAILFAAANGVKAARSLKDVVLAALVMDLPLSKIDEETIELIYRDPTKLSPEILAQYWQHPKDAYLLAKKALGHLSDASLELVYVHHELQNGRGFPRALRGHSIFPFGQFFCAAVDAFEKMKKSFLDGNPQTLRSVVESLLEEGTQKSDRRHSKEITENVLRFISTGE